MLRTRISSTDWKHGSNRRIRLFASAVLLAIVCTAVFAILPVHAQEDGRYFPETGHTIDGQFVRLFDLQGGLEVLGYPITDAFVDPGSGWLIQYFQNARMELVLDPDTGGMIPVLSPLGEWMNGWDPPAADTGNGADGCQYYSQSGHSVCFAFLDYYVSRGGAQILGLPISDFKLQGDRLVQYFQGFRLDWIQEADNPVRIAPLGRIHFDQMGYDPDLLNPVLPNNRMLHRVLDLALKSSVAKSVVTVDDTQEVYLLVRDQNLQPISGAAVTLFVHLPDDDRTLVMPVTDSQGISRLTLPVDQLEPGTVITLEFWVVYADVIRMTQDSFMVWW